MDDSVPLNITFANEDSTLLPTHTGSNPASITRAELVSSFANRILHSKFYKLLYLGMALLSVVCLVLSFIEQCPSGIFYWLDAALNLIMIVEVLIRVNAMGKNFWKSIWNVIDIFLVFLCILTLFWLIFGECQNGSGSWETELDAFLLIARNGLQLVRLIVMMNKNRHRLTQRGPQAIDFSNAAPAVDYLQQPDSGAVGTREDDGRAHVNQSSSVFDYEGEEDDWGF
ncbi:hypothetical protein CcCBS67573_g08963 [Chytriomyces confervae]|uniref:Ion transport domain-containing protein n=1 Tax=Chytriomyces confervae TaxID=246404 RepID=A0A507ECC2_9FUNG|nr:hypothetical protein CcCBS67573_g08963 [Chytriomyces confervae]